MITDLLIWLYSQNIPFIQIEKALKPTLPDLRRIDDSGILAGRLAQSPELSSEHRNRLNTGQWAADMHRIQARMEKADIKAVSLNDTAYPEGLRAIYAPPPLLFYQGFLPSGLQPVIGIVGSRKATPSGYQTAREIGRDLARSEMPVISGLAEGIDTAAHEGAVSSGGYTAAVLGNGLFRQFPASNTGLRKRIRDSGGCILSEFPLDMPALNWNFPRRNRIISGLCNGVALVEAGLRSGSLITATYALEQGRDLFAVPGSVRSPVSEGTNLLIKQGAVPITGAQDILDYYAITMDPPVHELPRAPLEPDEQALFALIYRLKTPTYDQLQTESGLTPGTLLARLTSLEIKGHVERWITGEYRCI